MENSRDFSRLSWRWRRAVGGTWGAGPRNCRTSAARAALDADWQQLKAGRLGLVGLDQEIGGDKAGGLSPDPQGWLRTFKMEE